ncbi:MAG: hypothetical protein PVI90_08325 [Desulfobacteraceae bacterium]|jgi:hypothetical protein
MAFNINQPAVLIISKDIENRSFEWSQSSYGESYNYGVPATLERLDTKNGSKFAVLQLNSTVPGFTTPHLNTSSSAGKQSFTIQALPGGEG